MMQDFRLSGNKPKHRVGDFRVGLTNEPENTFALIGNHNRHVRLIKGKLPSFSQGATKKISENNIRGLQTTIRCGVSRKLIVKTFRDGTGQVLEEN